MDRKSKGKWGVFRHDMFHTNEKEKMLGLVSAFDNYKEALKFSETLGKSSAIHII